MPAVVTRAQVRWLARLHAEMRADTADEFLSTSDVDTLIDIKRAEHWDMLIQMRGKAAFETVDTSLQTVVDVATVTLPDDYYMMLALDIAWAVNELEPVHELEHVQDRYKYVNGGSWGNGARKAFHQRGFATNAKLLEFFPTPTQAVNLVLRYVPTCPELVAGNAADDSAEIDSINGWHLAIALSTARDMRDIAGLDTTAVEKKYAQTIERIQNVIAERIDPHPSKIREVNPEGRVDDDWMHLRTPAG